jgi:hypothetical protein
MVTVIIPTCNRPQFLREALESVRQQTALDRIGQVIVSENGGCREYNTVCDGATSASSQTALARRRTRPLPSFPLWRYPRACPGDAAVTAWWNSDVVPMEFAPHGNHPAPPRLVRVEPVGKPIPALRGAPGMTVVSKLDIAPAGTGL